MTKDAFIREVRNAETMLYHISKSILRQTDKEYLAEMSQKKKTEQSETSFQKVLDAEIEKQK